jgi:hypothetical protein
MGIDIALLEVSDDVPAYDDGWLRELLAEMRDDVHRHMDRDDAAHKELRDAIAGLRQDLVAISVIGRVARWVVALAFSGGAVAWAIKHFIGLEK